ncbi:MAG: argininosuccinate synthase [Candidatus Ratteibacteria bacterium]|nr:argininosuccinate synthase [Candidatus Ratteibacteria bacterium]
MKIVLAYSGGLDTSVALKWLQDKYKAKVITYTANIGKGIDSAGLEEKAKKTGALKVYVEDLRKVFAKEFILPALKAGALYEGKYPLATALSRPLIAKRLVEIAKKEGADSVAHGCSGKGNDQVRFELTIFSLAPHLKIIAPLREWKMKSRAEEIEYAKKHNISVSVTKKSPYSIDENIWGTSIECGILEDPNVEPPEDAWTITNSIHKSLSQPQYIKIYFERGMPKKLNGKKYDFVSLIEKLKNIGAKHGIGRIDMVENRLIGIKSRELYEAPAAVILNKALEEIESLVLDRETLHFKEMISNKYAELVYYGLWYSPLKGALDAFLNSIHKKTTGEVTLKLHKGNCIVAGRKSLNSLYNEKMATYSPQDIFSHQSAKGFIELFGLPLKIQALKKTGAKRKKK